jgi:cell division protein FtsW (lipid II flippase)
MCAVFLAGAGILTLAQLAAGADNTRWLEFSRKHALLLILFGWILPVQLLASEAGTRDFWVKLTTDTNFVWAGLRWSFPLIVIILLLSQLMLGSEHGVWGIQPAEIAKLLLVFMAGFVGADIRELRSFEPGSFRKNPAPYIFKFLKFLIFIGLIVVAVLAGVRDISPILIMTVFVLAWIWKIAPHPRKPAGNGEKRKNNHKPKKSVENEKILRGAILLLTATVFIAGFWVYHSSEKELPDWMPQRNRLLVWGNPEQYPHSGSQILQAMALAGRGGWLGNRYNSWFSLNGEVMGLPAVQNDFIGSFFLFKFGGIAGMLLFLVQSGYVAQLFIVSRKSHEWATRYRDYRQRRAGHVLELILYGLAWMHITQWGIAWGNALGVLPVMGQPMTWIASANSHMMFFGLPALSLALMAERI